MDRGLKAAFLFSVLVVAQADRALTAHKPATGGLHAVALLRSTSTQIVVSATTASTIAAEGTISAVGNYMITNGNGTWTYSYYSNNGNLNGNDNGLGGDYVYNMVNPAWANSNVALGTYGTGAAASAVIVPSVDIPASAATAANLGQLQEPLSLYTLGLTDVIFTGAKTGIAVGRFNTFADRDEQIFVAAPAVAPSSFGAEKLNILLTYDGATTWVRATGVPKPKALPTTAIGVTGGIIVATPGGANTPPYPQITLGDLTSVFMASKTLGWAVGGNDVSTASLFSSSPALGNGAATGLQTVAAGVAAAAAAAAAGAVPAQPQNIQSIPLGLVLMTQNGGSVWKTVPIYISFAALTSLWKNNDPSLKSIFDGLIPGILFGVQSDASGKHVYAVGSPSAKFFKGSAAAGFTQITDNSAAATAVQIKSRGTILYSGNSGMSWVAQTAPTLYSGLVDYTLFDVAVQKGTTAIAVGGSATLKFGAFAAGTIIYTINGGFSWTQAVYPQSTGTKAPSFTCVSLQPAMSGSSVQTVWVGGFTSRTDISLAAVNTPGALTVTASSIAGADFYPVAAATGLTPTGNAAPNNFVGSGVPRSKGQIYTILISKDGGKTFAAAPTAGLPTGFVVTGNSGEFVTDRSVYGITWDNANHGWVYGFGFIMSTQNGGATWVYETPTDVGVTTTTPYVSKIASVPTTY